MDIVPVYTRLQAIGKLCVAAAWIVLILGIFLLGYSYFTLSSNAALYIDGGTYVFMLFLAFVALAIPIGTFTILLFASGALIAYLTLQEGLPEDEAEDEAVVGDQDDNYQLEISSISKSERDLQE